MTTLAALLGALPLALAFGTGSEFRVPLGIAIAAASSSPSCSRSTPRLSSIWPWNASPPANAAAKPSWCLHRRSERTFTRREPTQDKPVILGQDKPVILGQDKLVILGPDPRTNAVSSLGTACPKCRAGRTASSAGQSRP